MKNYREVNGTMLVETFGYMDSTYTQNIFFSWEDMYRYHEKNHPTLNDSWLYTSSHYWESVAFIEKLKELGTAIIYEEVA